jgi:hypothetical protein
MPIHIDPKDDVSDLHKKLDETLDSVSKTGADIVRKGHEIAVEGQSVVDWAEVTRTGSWLITDRQDLSHLVASWSRTDIAAKSFSLRLSGGLQILSSTTEASNVNSMLNLLPIASHVMTQPTTDVAAWNAVKRMRDLAGRPGAYDQCLILLQDLGFDQSPEGTISAVEHFVTAHKEYQINASSADSALPWLIPMRECILTVLATLLRNRPIQEEAKGTTGKVLSVLQQVARDGLQSGHIEDLADQCKVLLDERLSPSKHMQLSRAEGESFLLAGTHWLKSFLSAIDQARLRRPAR